MVFSKIITLLITVQLLFVLSDSYKIVGQTTDSIAKVHQKFDAFYGLNSELINGIKYFPLYTNARGSAFWEGDEPHIARLVLNGMVFLNQKIQYEINRQEFILTYKDQIGAESKIIVNHQILDSVIVDNHTFVKSYNKNIDQRFIEILYQGVISGYLGFKKEVKFVSAGIESGYVYSKQKKTNYIVYQNQVFRFKNNRSFLKVTPDVIRLSVNEYLKKNKITIRNASNEDIKMLFEYANKLLVQ
ncbi:MAG: hypothetical protein WCX31_16475 [Salinivirgaceae bacterium]